MLNRDQQIDLEMYTYADYASCIIDRRSTSHYYACLRGNLIT